MRWISVVLVAVSAVASIAAKAQDLGPIDKAERAALVALYRNTGGERWENKQGWLGPEGSECSWFGVTCSVTGISDEPYDPHYTVFSLELQENNLTGSLPEELNNLKNLDMFFLWRNHLVGSLPTGIRTQWQNGPLRIIGYAGQFTAQITEITLTTRSVEWCGDLVATIRADGSVTQRVARCRAIQGKEELERYCEVKTGRANLFAQDVDRLAYQLETSGFFALDAEYWRNMTHGGTTIIEVERGGKRKKVVNFGAFGPQSLWIAERLIEGILAETTWESTTEEKDCGFATRDV